MLIKVCLGHYLSALKPIVGFSSVGFPFSFGVATPAPISAGNNAAGILIGLAGVGGASKPATFFNKSSERETLIVMLLSLMINSLFVVDVSNIICCENKSRTFFVRLFYGPQFM